MVTLNRIYTRSGDQGSTRLANGALTPKSDPRVEAYGSVDETNAALGLARLHTDAFPRLDTILAQAQNELFDLGADLATPGVSPTALRILDNQVARLEREIDELNEDLAPLTSFVLPGGSPAAAQLHLARTICRRAEREAVRLNEAADGAVSPAALKYLNRLSDLLFVASRWANHQAEGDVLWAPGATRGLVATDPAGG